MVGDIWSPNWQYIPLIYHLYIANWVIICYLPPMKGTSCNFSAPFLAARFFQPCIERPYTEVGDQSWWRSDRYPDTWGWLVVFFLEGRKACWWFFSKKANFCRGNLYDHIYWYVIIHFHSIQFLIMQHMFEYLYIYIYTPVKGSLSIDIYINS